MTETIESAQRTKKRVYFVRHGQSEGNITPVFQHPDSPLSEIGQGAGDAGRRAFRTC